ncbi:MAG: hypothetical protein OEY14_14770 [Myxococcales bacterium]|nr:hypothetical protein [Myxococcales bacterium]
MLPKPLHDSLRWTAAILAAAASFLHIPLDWGGPAVQLAQHASATVEAPAGIAAPIERVPPPPPAPLVQAPPPRLPALELPMQLLPPRAYQRPPVDDFRLHAADGPASIERLEGLRGGGQDARDDPARVGEILLALGAQRQVIGDLRGAADYYEAYGRHAPLAGSPRSGRPRVGGAEGGEPCPSEIELRARRPCSEVRGLSPEQALENAIVYRRALGQRAMAAQDARLLVERLGRSDPAASIRAQRLASRLLEGEARAAYLERGLRRVRRLPTAPSERIQLLVEWGESAWATGHERDGLRILRRAERRWRRDGGEQMAAPAGIRPAAWIEELGRTREAVARARLRIASFRHRRFGELPTPTYEGVSRRVPVERWVRRRLRPWMQRKWGLLRVADRSYRYVLALGPTPSAIEAERARGRLYQELAEVLMAMRLPSAIEEETETGLVSTPQYREPVFRELIQLALERFRACFELARAMRYFGADSDRCADELARFEPARYGRPRELRRQEPWHPRVEARAGPPSLQ